jgi:hypothetical protein
MTIFSHYAKENGYKDFIYKESTLPFASIDGYLVEGNSCNAVEIKTRHSGLMTASTEIILNLRKWDALLDEAERSGEDVLFVSQYANAVMFAWLSDLILVVATLEPHTVEDHTSTTRSTSIEEAWYFPVSAFTVIKPAMVWLTDEELTYLMEQQ